eukprot:CAMPEP_0178995454 /NCGR_PEP_ID=MMETSP0795-20121207/7836_1 /TAXON_ID=88552 /ORGANISM="Amoebophrya sp., Strain Ameob2" /LENGTH=964 /DNA_ID=CAMNT_0020687763 /DNA_START=504 /DNA_END=3395 /DNA_ORIENTATION=+
MMTSPVKEPPGLAREPDGQLKMVPFEKRAVRFFKSIFIAESKDIAPAYLAKTLNSQQVMMAGGEQKPQPLGPDGKPVPDPVAEEKLRRKKIRTRNAYYCGMFWFLLLTATLVFTGLQYFLAVLPFTRDVYVTAAAGPRIAQRFVDFLDGNALDPVRRINQVLQRGYWRPFPSLFNHVSPIDFHLLETMFGSLLMAKRAIMQLDLGFEGTRQDIQGKSIRFLRLGEKEQVVMQTDLSQFCTEHVGIFGCVRSLEVNTQQWHKDMMAIDLATVMTQTILQPTHLDPFVPPPLLIKMPPICKAPEPVLSSTAAAADVAGGDLGTTTTIATPTGINASNGTNASTAASSSAVDVRAALIQALIQQNAAANDEAYGELNGPVDADDSRTLYELEKQLYYLQLTAGNCTLRAEMPFRQWLAMNETAQATLDADAILSAASGDSTSSGDGGTSLTDDGTNSTEVTTTTTTTTTAVLAGGVFGDDEFTDEELAAAEAYERSIFQSLGIRLDDESVELGEDGEEISDGDAQSVCINPDYVYNGDRLPQATVYERTMDRKYFLTRQKIQEEVYGRWDASTDERSLGLLLHTGSRIGTEKRLHSSLGFSVPVLSLSFKIRLPQYEGASQVDPMLLDAIGDVSHVTGRLLIDLTQFSPYLRESKRGVFSPNSFEAFIVDANGFVAASAFLDEQVFPLRKPDPQPAFRDGQLNVGVTHRGQLPPEQLRFKKLFETNKHFSGIGAGDLRDAPADGVVKDGVLILPLASSDRTFGEDKDMIGGNFFVLLWADDEAFADGWTVASSMVKMVLGGYPFALFVVVTILYAIRDMSVRAKGGIREAALFEAKLRILGPAAIEKDRQKEATDLAAAQAEKQKGTMEAFFEGEGKRRTFFVPRTKLDCVLSSPKTVLRKETAEKTGATCIWYAEPLLVDHEHDADGAVAIAWITQAVIAELFTEEQLPRRRRQTSPPPPRVTTCS